MTQLKLIEQNVRYFSVLPNFLFSIFEEVLPWRSIAFFFTNTICTNLISELKIYKEMLIFTNKLDT